MKKKKLFSLLIYISSYKKYTILILIGSVKIF